MLTPWVVVIIAGVGLFAGTLGGMLGVGGSIIMIPALAILFGQTDYPGFNQHLYQAAAMIVNLCVALPALRRHWKAGALVPTALRMILPAAMVCIVLGVWTSNLPIFAADGTGRGPLLLGRVTAAFLLYVIALNVYRLFRPAGDLPVEGQVRITAPRTTTVGSAMGFVAGLLGIGGGAVAVPLQQVLLRLPLRSCIANSSAIMTITAGVGALYKNASLAQHGLAWQNSVLIAGLLAPTAIIGAYWGAHLTHTVPLRLVRAIFVVLMLAAAWKMAALG